MPGTDSSSLTTQYLEVHHGFSTRKCFHLGEFDLVYPVNKEDSPLLVVKFSAQAANKGNLQYGSIWDQIWEW